MAAQTVTAAGQKQIQPHPGPGVPASQLPASLKRKQSQPRFRTRTTKPRTSLALCSVPRARGRDRPKKKKASRACVHCQKAHLTCDDGTKFTAPSSHARVLTLFRARPCQRCVKRGIADNCTEGHRKKAKYLLDEEELERLKSRRGKSSSVPEASAEPSPVQPAAPPPPPPPPPQAPLCNYTLLLFGLFLALTAKPAAPAPPFDPGDQMFAPVPFDPSFPFGSEAANLEYSILSAILGNPSPPQTTTSPVPSSGTPYSSWPSDDPMEFTARAIAVQPSDTTSPSTGFLAYGSFSQQQEQQEQQQLQYQSQFQQEPHPLQPRFPLDGRPRSPHFTDKESNGALRVGALSPSQSSFPHHSPEQQQQQRQPGGSQLANINDRVTMPYDYTEGYHFLMKHLPSRFEKNDILRIVRALAIFRPSLIALQMPLSFDDEVFVEKCFQRSLLRDANGRVAATGEICLVAPEFCMLTEWSLDELVGRKKYIYELFENQSVVEYWENFASHAFENTTQSVYSHCVLLKPNGAPVPSTFCLSIRRDLFDLPSVVIGQWLPLL
ncbi:hypothetical protein K438DRAFT_1753207 [Mycena galopus ATCC 62051]|nr:hypothetical protein K438DRAFT_1753207 [Mycena galopus ATCC 62051]